MERHVWQSYLRIHGIVDPDCFGNACIIGLGQLGMFHDREKNLTFASISTGGAMMKALLRLERGF